jgi:dienelactone hydrolase
MMKLSRRQLMQWSGLLAPLVGATRPALAQSAQPSYERDLPDMLLAHLAMQLNALAVKWDAVRDSIRTGADVESRNRFVREAMGKMLHGIPAHHPPPGVVVRTQERNGYRVENLMFESRPDFWVTGNLYIPTTGRAPCPAIISPCGHYSLARMQPDYQAVYQNLVHNGFVVLAYDPIGQGERRQYWDPQTGQADISDPVYEHSMPGQVLLLMGQDLTHYMVWDGMRAIDYLLTRPEVDASRIGCAGHSGGGTLTMFISAVDERVRCAVINEGGTRHRWPLWIQSGDHFGPSDVEQNLFPAADYGVDLCDLHVAMAPRPLLALVENYSPAFDLAAAHIRRRYEQLGVADKFATAAATDPHAYTYKLRLATTDWFCRWFYGRPGPATEPDLHFEPPASLYCTPHGSLRYAGQGQTIFTLIRKRGAELPPPRQVPANAAGQLAFRNEMQSRIKSLLHFEHSREPLAVRRIVTTPRKGYAIEKLEFLSEPGIYVPAWVFVPERKVPGRVILYANEAGKQADGMEYGVLEHDCGRCARHWRDSSSALPGSGRQRVCAPVQRGNGGRLHGLVHGPVFVRHAGAGSGPVGGLCLEPAGRGFLRGGRDRERRRRAVGAFRRRPGYAHSRASGRTGSHFLCRPDGRRPLSPHGRCFHSRRSDVLRFAARRRSYR